MFLTFFTELRAAKVPVTLREYLTLLEALDADLAEKKVEDFYYLSRACLVKDERNLDKFDRVFGHVFKGMESLGAGAREGRDPRGMAAQARREIPHRGGEGADRGDGLGQAARDAEGAPEGAEGPPPGRLEMDRHRRHLALRRLWLQSRRHPHRPGRQPQLPRGEGLGQARVQGFRRHASSSACATCASRCAACAASPARARPRSSTSTARSTRRPSKGYLDVKLRPERRNAVKVLLFLDVGGSMDWHVEQAEELFSAARAEFKHFEHFYFHNCPYERVWKENRRRHDRDDRRRST